VVFTGGISEHAVAICEEVCRNAGWLGVKLNSTANQHGCEQISSVESPVPVFMIPIDEDVMIARHTVAVLKGEGGLEGGRLPEATAVTAR
jgi:acetate kinase